MNVLAHIYLSGDSEKIIIGNYIGDYVKGRDYLKYPEAIRKGIILHRHIDELPTAILSYIEAKFSLQGSTTSTRE